MSESDQSRLFTIVLFGVPALITVGAWVTGLALHGLGRSTKGMLGLVVFAFGAVLGAGLTAAVGLLEQQASLSGVIGAVWLLGAPLIGAVVLAMTGHRRAAGLLLAGAATPWTIVWGIYLVAFVLGAAIEPLFTVTMLVAGLAPLLIGVAVAAAGDPVPEPDAAAPIGGPGSRRPGAMGRRLVADATYGAVGPSVVLVLVTTAAVGFALPSQPILQLLAALGAAVAGTELELRWIPPAVRPAIEAFHWVGRAELARFKEAMGTPSPASKKGFREWLARHPESHATRVWRVEMLTMLGDLGEARSELDRFVPATPIERLHATSLGIEIGWIQGGPADLDALATLAGETGADGSPARLHADGLVAWSMSRVGLAAMDPHWLEPLDRFRVRLGTAADGLHATAMRRRTLTLPVILAGGFVLLGQLRP